jgi:hypothetical protein
MNRPVAAPEAGGRFYERAVPVKARAGGTVTPVRFCGDAVMLLFVLEAQKANSKPLPPNLRIVLKGPAPSRDGRESLWHRRKFLFVEANAVAQQRVDGA